MSPQGHGSTAAHLPLARSSGAKDKPTTDAKCGSNPQAGHGRDARLPSPAPPRSRQSARTPVAIHPLSRSMPQPGRSAPTGASRIPAADISASDAPPQRHAHPLQASQRQSAPSRRRPPPPTSRAGQNLDPAKPSVLSCTRGPGAWVSANHPPVSRFTPFYPPLRHKWRDGECAQLRPPAI
jgi:hypothetical protein